MEKRFNSKITQWGLNLGLRIPKEIVTQHNFSDKEIVEIVFTRNGFQVTKLNPESEYDFVI